MMASGFPPGESRRIKHILSTMLIVVGLLYLIKLVEMALHLDLLQFGIYPRSLLGLRGIFLAPLIHGSLFHLFSNTMPLLVLGGLTLYAYPRASRWVIPAIVLLGGLGVWLFARPSYHIGASGLTYGLMFFVFVSGWIRRDKLAIALSMIVFFLYGGMVWGIFPREQSVSFESHFFGALVGVVAAVLSRKSDPPAAEKVYDWELNDDDLDDELIGDQWRKED